MSDYTKRFVAYAVMIVGIAWAIAFAVVMTNDAPSSPDENFNYTYCVENGGSYIENGIGEGFTCTMPTPVPATS